MSYLARWEKLKTDFEANTGRARPKEETKKFLIGTVQKASGVTPVLKDVDTAIEKKQRTPLEQSLNKLMAIRSSYCTFLTSQQSVFAPGKATEDLAIWTEYRDLIKGLEAIETDASKDAKTLQEEKSPGKQGIMWLSLEGDLKGTVEAAQKQLKPFAALEKKADVLKKANSSIKAAEEYTKAAARTQPTEARQALNKFKTEAAKCADDLDKIAKAATDVGFKKAVTSFQSAMKALSVAARVDAQINNLKAMEATAG
jgi:hypothetical protein